MEAITKSKRIDKFMVIIIITGIGAILSILAVSGLQLKWHPLVTGLLLVIGPACLVSGLIGLIIIKK